MRVVHVSDCYPPRLGGIETQVRALAGRQALAGHDVHVLTATAGDDGFAGTEVRDGVTVHRYVAGLPFGLPVHPRVVGLTRGALTDLAPDAVHVHGGVVSPFAYPAVRVATGLGAPTVVTIHGVWGPLMGPVARLADAAVHWSGWGAQVTAVSDAAADPIRAAAPGLDVGVLPNGIDAAAWQVTHVPAPAGVVRALAVMRLAPRKRGLPLLQVAARAAARLGRRRLELTVVGEGPTRRALQAYAARHDLAVRFTGRITPEQVREELARADVFVAPATRESFGIAALEARTAGVPVLALRRTGVASFVRDGVEGLLAADDTDLTEQLVRLAVDDALRERIARYDATTAPDQDWGRVLPLVEQAYARAAGRAVG